MALVYDSLNIFIGHVMQVYIDINGIYIYKCINMYISAKLIHISSSYDFSYLLECKMTGKISKTV